MKRWRFSSPGEVVGKAASDWIARRDAGLTDAEEAAFRAWRGANPRHAEALARYEKLWLQLDRPRVSGRASKLKLDLARLRQRERRRRMCWTGAAGVSLLALCATLLLPLSTISPPAAATAAPPLTVMVPERLTLADGTVVEYSRGAEIAVDFSSPQFRRLTLVRGEAHFEVAKDRARPFIVQVNGVNVQAVGTAFSVRLGQSAVEVLVTEGRVAVDTEDSSARLPASPGATPITVDAGQKVAVTFGPGAMSATSLPENLSSAEMAQRLGWRNPRMAFSNVPLNDVVTAINRYASDHGGTRFSLTDPALGAKRLSGIFRVDDPDVFVAILEQGFGVEAERHGEKLIMFRARR